jgi:hypothetical protein
MTTASSDNSFIRNGELYVLFTLTSDVIGREGIFDGYTFNLMGCTNTNLTACGAVSNATSGTFIRISTKAKRSIRYGKVEARVNSVNCTPSLVGKWEFQAGLSPLGMQLARWALSRE